MANEDVESGHDGFYIVCGIYLFFFFIGYALFVMRRNAFPIKTRGIFWTSLSAWTGAAFVTHLTIRFGDPSSFPCYLWMAFGTINLSLWAGPYLVRCWITYYNYKWNEEKIRKTGDWYLKHKYLLSFKLHVGIIVLLTILHFTLEFSITASSSLDWKNVNSEKEALCRVRAAGLAQSSLSVPYILGTIFFIYKMRDTRDSFYIRSELIILMAVLIPTFVLFFMFGFAYAYGQRFMLLLAYSWSLCVTIYYPLYLSFFAAENTLKYSTSFEDLEAHQNFLRSSNNILEVGNNINDDEINHEEDIDTEDLNRAAAVAITDVEGSENTQQESQSQNFTEIPLQPMNAATSNDNTGTAVSSAAAPAVSNPKTVAKSGKAGHNRITQLTAKRNLLTNVPSKMSKGSRSSSIATTVEPFQYIMDNSVYLDALKQFSIQSWCSESILFLIDYQSLLHKENYSKSDVFKIRDDYVKPGAQYEVNIPQSIMRSAMQKVEANPTPAAFEEVYTSVFSNVKVDVYPRFRASQLFKQARAQVSKHYV